MSEPARDKRSVTVKTTIHLHVKVPGLAMACIFNVMHTSQPLLVLVWEPLARGFMAPQTGHTSYSTIKKPHCLRGRLVGIILAAHLMSNTVTSGKGSTKNLWNFHQIVVFGGI